MTFQFSIAKLYLRTFPLTVVQHSSEGKSIDVPISTKIIGFTNKASCSHHYIKHSIDSPLAASHKPVALSWMVGQEGSLVATSVFKGTVLYLAIIRQTLTFSVTSVSVH